MTSSETRRSNYYTTQNSRGSSSSESSFSPMETGHKLLSVLQDVLPMVDQDPEWISLMQDVSKLVNDQPSSATARR